VFQLVVWGTVNFSHPVLPFFGKDHDCSYYNDDVDHDFYDNDYDDDIDDHD